MTPEALEEAVAKAIYEAENYRGFPVMAYEELPVISNYHLHRKARAALAVVREKMREPTPEMLDFWSGEATGVKRRIWQSMIAASPLGGDT